MEQTETMVPLLPIAEHARMAKSLVQVMRLLREAMRGIGKSQRTRFCAGTFCGRC